MVKSIKIRENVIVTWTCTSRLGNSKLHWGKHTNNGSFIANQRIYFFHITLICLKKVENMISLESFLNKSVFGLYSKPNLAKIVLMH